MFYQRSALKCCNFFLPLTLIILHQGYQINYTNPLPHAMFRRSAVSSSSNSPQMASGSLMLPRSKYVSSITLFQQSTLLSSSYHAFKKFTIRNISYIVHSTSSLSILLALAYNTISAHVCMFDDWELEIRNFSLVDHFILDLFTHAYRVLSCITSNNSVTLSILRLRSSILSIPATQFLSFVNGNYFLSGWLTRRRFWSFSPLAVMVKR